jgi:hypothetical protein
VNSDDEEAILDAEYASAAAPSADIELASCGDTSTTFGGLIALQNLLNGSSAPPALVSISYGYCETLNGASANAAYNAAYQQAAGEGVSVFVSSGDEGAASCDADESWAVHTESQSVASPQLLITFRSAVLTSAIVMLALIALIGMPLTHQLTNRPSPISTKFRGTIPAPARCLRLSSAIAKLTDRAAFATAARRQEERLPDYGVGQRRTERLRHRVINVWSSRRKLRGMAQAIMAIAGGKSQRRGTRYSRCLAFCRQRSVGTLLSVLLQRPMSLAIPAPARLIPGREREARRSLHRLWQAFRLW